MQVGPGALWNTKPMLSWGGSSVTNWAETRLRVRQVGTARDMYVCLRIKEVDKEQREGIQRLQEDKLSELGDSY